MTIKPSEAKRHWRCLPNAITVSRIALVPVVAWLLIGTGGSPNWTAGAIFAVAALTDQVDGWLARRWHVVSTFGKLADPLADKLMIGTVTVILIAQSRLPLLAIGLLAVRQAGLWSIRIVLLRGKVLSPSLLSKLSAWVLYAALGALIVTQPGAMWPLVIFWAGVALALGEIGLYLRYVTRKAPIAATAPTDS